MLCLNCAKGKVTGDSELHQRGCALSELTQAMPFSIIELCAVI